MKKLCIFLAYVLCAQSYGMETDLSQEQIKKEAAKTAARFGGFDYLAHAVKEHGGPAVVELEKVRSVMADPSYAFVLVNKGPADLRNFFVLYKKDEKGKYISVGLAIYSFHFGIKDCVNYHLAHLSLSCTERGRGRGAALFLYTLHAMRQLNPGVSLVNVRWIAEPLDSASGPDQRALNRFYERMGGGKLGCRIAFGCDFEWQGLPLAPFDQVIIPPHEVGLKKENIGWLGTIKRAAVRLGTRWLQGLGAMPSMWPAP